MSGDSVALGSALLPGEGRAIRLAAIAGDEQATEQQATEQIGREAWVPVRVELE